MRQQLARDQTHRRAGFTLDRDPRHSGEVLPQVVDCDTGFGFGDLHRAEHLERFHRRVLLGGE